MMRRQWTLEVSLVVHLKVMVEMPSGGAVRGDSMAVSNDPGLEVLEGEVEVGAVAVLL